MNRAIKIFSYENIDYEFIGVESDHIFKHIGRDPFYFYESKLLKFIQELNIDGIYIDVGANIGNHSLFFANHCKSDKVICFEPEKECFLLLVENMYVNSTKNYRVNNLGVMDNKGICYLMPFPDHSNMGLSKVVEKNYVDHTEIDVVKLDDHIDYNNKIGLIKIDTEGAELKVLQGAVNIINAWHPVIICEAAEQKDKKILDEFLLGFGYARTTLQFNATPTYIWKI